MSSLVQDELGQASEAAAGGAASVVYEQLIQEWEKCQVSEPTNPYRVLGVKRSVSPDTLRAAFDRKVSSYKEADHDVESASHLFIMRAERAYALLSDADRRRAYEKDLQNRIGERRWAKLRYANGFYEGGVDPTSMVEHAEPQREGTGITVLAGGEKFEGPYNADGKSGLGLQLWDNGDLYLGHWAKDVMAGRGSLFYGNGMRYIGEFHEGRRHGVGKLSWPDGSTYGGEFLGGNRHGHGVLEVRTSTDGATNVDMLSRYVGEWSDSHLHGKGCYENFQKVGKKDGRYDGQFERSACHGEGRMELANGDVYEGNFERGRRDGKGCYEWVTGDRYRGPMRKNHVDGQGIFESQERGIMYAGQWTQSMPHGTGILQQDVKRGDGDRSNVEYEGQWDFGHKDGQGVFRYSSGSSYAGGFSMDRRQGTGKLCWEDGSTWEGAFLRDERHGAGVFRGPPDSDEVVEILEVWRKGELVESNEFAEDSATISST